MDSGSQLPLRPPLSGVEPRARLRPDPDRVDRLEESRRIAPGAPLLALEILERLADEREALVGGGRLRATEADDAERGGDVAGGEELLSLEGILDDVLR